MGVPNSKFGKEIEKNELQQGSLPSTPILTPKTMKHSEMDPRSPSLHIARTPLELLSAAAEKLELLNDTPVRHNKLLLGIDPRSPTTDFKRTPIIINAEGEFPRKLHNKNFDKVIQSELQSAFLQGNEQSKDSSKSAIPPKLLQSSPLKQRSDAYKRRSLAGLLETNIDFTETDLDKVLQEKCKIEAQDKEVRNNVIPENLQTAVEAKGKDEVQNIPEIEDQKENVLKQTLHDNKTEEQSISNNYMNAAEIVPESPKKNILNQIDIKEKEENKPSPAVKVDDNLTENHTIEENEFSSPSTEMNTTIQIADQIKSAPVTPPSISSDPILPSQETKSAPVTPPLVNLTADVKELDKKLTNLIYEDDLVVCPRIVKIKDTTERSPLRNCNGNEPRAKSAQKLKVSDKPRRSEYAVSKIPVFKENKSKLRNVQCENTPPRNMEKNKLRHRKSDWDTKDNTLYL